MNQKLWSNHRLRHFWIFLLISYFSRTFIYFTNWPCPCVSLFISFIFCASSSKPNIIIDKCCYEPWSTEDQLSCFNCYYWTNFNCPLGTDKLRFKKNRLHSFSSRCFEATSCIAVALLEVGCKINIMYVYYSAALIVKLLQLKKWSRYYGTELT